MGTRVTSTSVIFARLTSKVRLRHLQLLVAIDDFKSLQKAAKHVGLSQPAATHAVSELEALLEGSFFHRHHRGMVVTDLGKIVMPMARNILHAIHDCAEAISAKQQGAEVMLGIGANGAATYSLLTRYLPSFNKAHPEIVINIVEIGGDGFSPLTDDRQLDVVLTREPRELPSGFGYLRLLSDRYVVVSGTHHSLAGVTSPDTEALEQSAWLMPPTSGIASRDLHLQLKALDISPRFCWVSSRNILLVLSLLESHELLAFIPHNTARELLTRGLLVEIKCPVHVEIASLGAIFNEEKRRAEPALSQFLEHLSGFTDALVPKHS